MSDIDFDELDRAVNGVIGGEPASKPIVKTSTPEPPIAEAVKTPVVTTAPAVRRTSGRFMDMVHPSSDMRTKSNISPVTPRSEAENTPVAETPQATSWSEPLESPFLPDAKVEKRPLGGSGIFDEPKEELLEAPEPQELLEASAMPDPIDFAAAQAVTDDMELKATMPEDLLEVATPVEPAAPAEQAPLAEKTLQPEVDEPVGPTSITQQYTEQPSANQESGAIYDTESYHQPVAKAVKKKSGLLTVVWILLLVVLGAAAGWIAYAYILPML